jgi:hypothetical protein
VKTELSLACVAVLGLLSVDARAQSCTPISSFPANIDAPGSYCLVQDGSTDATEGTLINIAANDVTLDCQQHTLKSGALSATGSSSAIVAYERNNVRIRNCRIIGGFTYGINVSQDLSGMPRSYYNIVEDNYVAGPYSAGIIAFGSAIEVRGNRVFDIGGQLNQPSYGIRVGGPANGFKFQTVHGNHVVGTNSPARYAYGIYSDASTGSVFHENLVNGTSGGEGYPSYGLRIVSGTGNTITSNYVLDAGDGNSIGIGTPNGGGWCYDNQIRTGTWTRGCDASLGNY